MNQPAQRESSASSIRVGESRIEGSSIIPPQDDQPYYPPRPPLFEKRVPFIAALVRMTKNPIANWPRAMYEEDFYTPVKGFISPVINVIHPDAVRAVCLDHHADAPKADAMKRLLGPGLGDALLTADGAHWRWQRQATAPAFRHDRLQSMVPMMIRAGEAAAQFLANRPHNSVVDVTHVTTQATFDVILDSMFKGDPEFDVESFTNEIRQPKSNFGSFSILAYLRTPLWVRDFLFPKSRRSRLALRQAVLDMIARRNAHGEKRGDLYDLLQDASDPETGRKMDKETLRDNLLTFVAAGHETTALAVAWALLMVASHRPTKLRIQEELDRVIGEGPLSPQMISRLTFTKQVVQETLRLYPSAPVLARQIKNPITVCGHRLRKNRIALIPIFAIHRHTKWWSDPDRFDPDRFTPENIGKQHRFAYLPFGAGPRICIGGTFAMLESIAILAAILHKIDVKPEAGHTPMPTLRVTLQPEGGIRLHVRTRETVARANIDHAAKNASLAGSKPGAPSGCPYHPGA